MKCKMVPERKSPNRNEYQRTLLSNDSPAHIAQKERARAAQKASVRLRQMFSVEYEVFYQEELAKEPGRGKRQN